MRTAPSVLWRRQVEPPTLVGHGGADPIVAAANGRILVWSIPAADPHIVPGGGHRGVLAWPAVVAGAIDGFRR